MSERSEEPVHCHRCDAPLWPDDVAGREGSLVWCAECMDAMERMAAEDPSPAERCRQRVAMHHHPAEWGAPE